MDPFAALEPTSDRYATLPIESAFTWTAVAADLPPGTWYLVAFRSVRRAEADEDRLAAFDDRAHEEALGSPGFVHYFKGPRAADGTCLSFCLWSSRTHARDAAARPAHREAVALVHEMYADYRLEFLRVTKRHAGAALEFEPWDAARPDAPASPLLPHPRPAPA